MYSEPKKLSDYQDDDIESVKSSDSIDTTDTDKPVEVKHSSDEIQEGFTNIEEATKTDISGVPDVKPNNPKTSPTTSTNDKESSSLKFFFAIERFIFGAFSNTPDLSGQSVGKRITTGITLTISRLLLIILLIFVGLFVKYASHNYNTEEYFPHDIAKPPYYPTSEELAKYEPTRDLRKICKDDPYAPFIGKFRNPDQTYPEYLYYTAMDLPHADPCIVDGVATGTDADKTVPKASSDNMLIRWWVQVKSLFSVLGAIFSNAFSAVVNFFKSSAEGVESGLVELATEPEMKLLDEAEQEGEKAFKAYIQGEKELEEARQGQNKKQQTNQVGQGKPRRNRPQRGGASADASQSSSPTKSTHEYDTYLNVYALDKTRTKEDIGWPYYPIIANSTKLCASVTNNIALKLMNFVNIISGKTGQESETSSAMIQFLRVIAFTLVGILIITLTSNIGPLVSGLYIPIISIASIVMAGKAEPLLALLFFPLIPLAVPAMGLNWLLNVGILSWRLLYFAFTMFIRPLGEFQAVFAEFVDIIRKNPSGILVMVLLLSTLSGYQVAQEEYKAYFILGVVLAVVMMGVNIQLNGTSSTPTS